MILKIKHHFLWVLFLFISNCATSQIDSVPVETDPGPAEVDEQKAKPINGYPIGVGDEVKITVWKNGDLTRTIRVGPSGTIFYPLVGEIPAKGIGTEDLRKKITQGLDNYIISPQVNVDITAFRSRKLYVVGEVERPGRLIIEDHTNIMDALTLAGGMTIHANEKNVILVRQSPSQLQLHVINIKNLYYEADLTQLVYLQSGDIVFVPPTYIEQVARFFDYVRRIFRGITAAQWSIILGDQIYDIVTGQKGDGDRTIIIQDQTD